MPFKLDVSKFTAAEWAWFPIINFFEVHSVVERSRASFDTAGTSTPISAAAVCTAGAPWWRTTSLGCSSVRAAAVVLLGGLRSFRLAGIAEHGLELVVLRLPLSYRARPRLHYGRVFAFHALRALLR